MQFPHSLTQELYAAHANLSPILPAQAIPTVPSIQLREDDDDDDDESELAPPGVDFKYASKEKKKGGKDKSSTKSKGAHKKDKNKRHMFEDDPYEVNSPDQANAAAAILTSRPASSIHTTHNSYRTNDMTTATSNKMSTSSKKPKHITDDTVNPADGEIGKYEVRSCGNILF